AEAVIEERRLELLVVDRTTDQQPRDTVLEQTPAAGAEVPLSTEVRVVVSNGALIKVPSLIGRPFATARKITDQLRLVLQATGIVFSTLPQGRVVSQEPQSGTEVDAGALIRVQTSRGPAPTVVVPNFIGMGVSQASIAASRVRLRLTNDGTIASAAVKGTVVSQNPVAGKQVASGSAVSVQVSDGKLVFVPNLIGQKPATAKQILAAADLRIEMDDPISSNVAKGLVASQIRALFQGHLQG
ncbi:MAG: PASTA domain-containing protein, partial [bacterium]|nr:PASTA domain-containing protein [bacterium]